MNNYRIVKKTNSYGDSWYLVQEKGLLWGWNTVCDQVGIHDVSISLERHFESEASARDFIKKVTFDNVVKSEILS